MMLAFDVNQAAENIGIGRTKLYQAMASGQLKAKKFGKRTLITNEDLTKFLAELPNFSGGRDE